jgi:L-rhamnose isomerase
MKSRNIQAGYDLAKQSYLGLGIDTDAAITAALRVPISMHCWQVG